MDSPTRGRHIDSEDSVVRELVSFINSQEAGELGQLFRTARAVYQYLRSELSDHLISSRKSDPEAVSAAINKFSGLDPSCPNHEIMSDLAVSSLGSYLRRKRQFSMLCSYDFMVSSSSSGEPVGPVREESNSKAMGLGKVPPSGLAIIRTRHKPSLKFGWYAIKRSSSPSLVLSGYSSKQLEILFLKKFASKPTKVGNSLVVPYELWNHHRRNLYTFTSGIVSGMREKPSSCFAISIEGDPKADSQARDAIAADASSHLKELACKYIMPVIATASCPMVYRQKGMPPVLWYSLMVNEDTGVATLIGPDKTPERLSYWRQL